MTTELRASPRLGPGDGQAEGESRSRSVINAARRSLGVAYDKTRRGIETVVDYGSQHPRGLSLVAFGAGLGIGMLVAAQGRRRRPAIGTALAEAIGTFARHLAR